MPPRGTPIAKQIAYAKEGYEAAKALKMPTHCPYGGSYAWEPQDTPAACWYRGYWFFMYVAYPWRCSLSGRPNRGYWSEQA